VVGARPGEDFGSGDKGFFQDVATDHKVVKPGCNVTWALPLIGPGEVTRDGFDVY
jgi:hypothetical protein